MAATRNALLRSALELFCRHGFNGVGINELCSHAGLTRGGFYHHFRSKAALLRALFVESADTNRLPERCSDQPLTALEGSAVASLSIDVARGGADLREAYANCVDTIVTRFSQENGVSIDTARAIVALTVGGLLVTAACEGEPESQKMKEAVTLAMAAIHSNDKKDHQTP